MDEDRLQWIYAATNERELRERYDVWADDYDDDVAAMRYLAPNAAAEQCHRVSGPHARVLDAGCGTGLVGADLRAAGVGHLVGLDLSPEMLRRARERGVYDELHEGSVLEPLPFPAGAFDAVVAAGVFTWGHVGPAAFAGLAAAVRPGGFVVVTLRDDALSAMEFDREIQRLERDDVWTLLECSDPAPLIEEGGVGADMRVWTWRVNG